MTLKNLIDLCDIKEKQAFALTSYLSTQLDNDKTNINDLQNQVNLYCDNLVHSFICKHKENLKNKDLLLGLQKHILSIGANLPNSGYRFYETLYKQLKNHQNLFVTHPTKQL